MSAASPWRPPTLFNRHSPLPQVKEDRSILAAVLCGSLSHDTVRARSDIDLVFVTVDDKPQDDPGLALYADGVNVHAILMPRTTFRRIVEGATHQSFHHSLLAKGRLLYRHDPTIATLCDSLQTIGARDARLQLLRSAMWGLAPLDKACKWLVTRGDLDYTALSILYAATPRSRTSHTGRYLRRHLSSGVRS